MALRQARTKYPQEVIDVDKEKTPPPTIDLTSDDDDDDAFDPPRRPVAGKNSSSPPNGIPATPVTPSTTSRATRAAITPPSSSRTLSTRTPISQTADTRSPPTPPATIVRKPEDSMHDSLEYYGTQITKIRGLKHHATKKACSPMPGDAVFLRRELGNPTDANAIEVCRVAGDMELGYIPHPLAARLALFLDSGELHVTGVVAGKVSSRNEAPLDLRYYGTSEAEGQERLKLLMVRRKLLEVDELVKVDVKAQDSAKEG